MRKIAIAAFVSMFVLGSSVTMASGNLESGLTPIRAEDMLNYMSCLDKDPGDRVRSRTRTKNGKVVTVKCADANKIVEDAKSSD